MRENFVFGWGDAQTRWFGLVCPRRGMWWGGAFILQESKDTCMSKMIEQTTENALLRCNITVSTRKNKNVLKKRKKKNCNCKYIHRRFLWSFIFVFFIWNVSSMYPALFRVLFFSPVWLVGRQGDSDSALKGKHKTLLFSVTVHFSAAIFSLVF